MGLENTGSLSPVSSVLGLGGAFQKGLVFLLNLAWNSRFRLPVLITVGFMVLDVRMQLEINVDIEVRHVHVPEEDDEEDDDDEDDDDEEEEEEEDEDGLDFIENQVSNSENGNNTSNENHSESNKEQ